MSDDRQLNPNDLDQSLERLGDTLSSIVFLLSAVIDLRRSATRLMVVLKDELTTLRERIDETVERLP